MSAYVTIRIVGNRAERLLEQMRNASIMIYALQRNDDTTVELIVSAADFKRLHAFAKQSNCKIHIVHRLGYTFAVRRLFLRYTLWGTSLVMLLFMLFASKRILWIDVDGCSKIAEKTILRALSEEGIRIGSPQQGLDFPTLNNRIRMYDDRIAWIGLSLDGVVLRANIVEFLQTDEAPSESQTDIVAQKSGRITEINTISGRSMVSIGDLVSVGDCLITGNLTTEESQYPVYMQASGQVRAEIIYIAEAIANSEEEQLSDNGNSIPYLEIRLAGRSLFTSEIPYANYALRDFSSTQISDIMFPIELLQGVCYEQTEQTHLRTQEEMIEAALCEAETLCNLKIPKDALIKEKHAAWVKSDDCILGIVTIITEETIGMTKEITIGIEGSDFVYDGSNN